jgi:hypothetical protein
MFSALLLMASLPIEPGPVDLSPDGYLYQATFCLDHTLRGPVRPFVPQPGDIYLSTENAWTFARIGHRAVGSGAPQHSGILFALPDGQMALLEAGPQNTQTIRVLDLIPQLTMYNSYERVWIRQRSVPLTPAQAHRLTVFAMAVKDKPFAVIRLGLEGGPFRSKGPIRTVFVGRPYAAKFDPENPEPGLRRSYYCSELVAEALVAACAFDPKTSRPPSVYPRELFFGTSNNPYLRCHMDMSEWCPPARWTHCPGSEAILRPRPWLDGDTSR